MHGLANSLKHTIIRSYVASYPDYRIYTSNPQGRQHGGATGAFCPGLHSAGGPRRLIYSNRTVKYSIKAVITSWEGPTSVYLALGPLNSLGGPEWICILIHIATRHIDITCRKTL